LFVLLDLVFLIDRLFFFLGQLDLFIQFLDFRSQVFLAAVGVIIADLRFLIFQVFSSSPQFLVLIVQFVVLDIMIIVLLDFYQKLIVLLF
jgi:hypothetical protein